MARTSDARLLGRAGISWADTAILVGPCNDNRRAWEAGKAERDAMPKIEETEVRDE